MRRMVRRTHTQPRTHLHEAFERLDEAVLRGDANGDHVERLLTHADVVAFERDDLVRKHAAQRVSNDVPCLRVDALELVKQHVREFVDVLLL